MQVRPGRDRRPLLIAAVFALLFVSGLGAWPSVHAQLCPSILVASSNEKYLLMKSLARVYSSEHPGPWSGCGPAVDVEKVASGDAERQLWKGWPGTRRPDVWSPAASTWVRLLKYHRPDLVPDVQHASIAASPLVVAIPEPMATLMGWQKDPPTWTELFTFAKDLNFWGRHGRPEWGAFRLGKTDPGKSTSGIHSLIAAYYAVTGKLPDLTDADINAQKTRDFVAGVEANVGHYAPTVSSFLDNLAIKDPEPWKFISALPVEEQEVFYYNQGGHSKPGGPRIYLTPVYPAGGTMVADHPFVVLSAPWVSAAKEKTASAFLTWLQARPQQERFSDQGFRNSELDVVGDHARWIRINTDHPHVLTAPSGAIIAQVQKSWKDEFRKRARILIVLALADASQRKYVRDGVEDLSREDEVAVWSLAHGRSPSRLDMTSLVAGSKQVTAAIESASTASGQVPLYGTISEGYRWLKDRVNPKRINAIVVIAASKDDDSGPSLSELEHQVASEPTGTPIRIFTVALKGSDDKLLHRIEEASGGVDTSSGDAASAIRAALANF
jgi:Ca-activated chloride channel family protein